MQKKDEFINITAHEFRTPLTSIKATLQFIGRMKFSSEEGRKIFPFIEKADNQVKRLTGILKDLLDVTKISNGILELRPQWFPVAQVIEESIDEIKADDSSLMIELSGALDATVEADRFRIAQVITNLLANAVKYSNSGAPVRIQVYDNGEHVQVAVTDEGVGIPADKLPHVFDRYFRVEETSQNYSGMGLGLYIAKGIVEQHHGEIGAESIVGQGTTVWFTLPRFFRS
jgi:signal transduction histidine kinase